MEKKEGKKEEAFPRHEGNRLALSEGPKQQQLIEISEHLLLAQWLSNAFLEL